MRILFQGDGSSDDPGRSCPGIAGKSTTDCQDLGEGYPKYAAVMFTDAYPDIAFTFYRGRTDGEAPDLVCVMPDFNGDESDEIYERTLLERLCAFDASPQTRVLVFEPYLAKESDATLRDRVDDRVNATRRAVAQRADVLVPLDGLFAAARIARPDIEYADENGLTPEGFCFLGECCLRAASGVIEEYLRENETE